MSQVTTAELAPLPATIRLLRNEELARLRDVHPGLTPSPERCITCRGKGSFRWWGAKVGPEDPPVLDYTCDCMAQWQLYLYLLNANIGLTYQRLGWSDVDAEPGAVDKVFDYIRHAEGYVAAGFGLILYGEKGAGKTLLSTLVLKHLLGLGYDGYFTTFSEMIDTYTGGWNSPEEKRWFHRRIKNTKVLVVDDVGKEHKQRRMVGAAEADRTGTNAGMRNYSTAVAESTFDNVLRHRAASGNPTIITTNLDLDKLQEGYGGNVMSLLQERSSTYRFTGDDFRNQARSRLVDEMRLGLTRPVVLE